LECRNNNTKPAVVVLSLFGAFVAVPHRNGIGGMAVQTSQNILQKRAKDKRENLWLPCR